MPSTYTFLRPILRLALDLYYVDIQVVGGEAIPEEGPLILAANHPNSLMDTVILGTQTSRRIHYLARSGLFEHRVGRVLFRKLGAIPIYRPEDNPASQGTQMARPLNDATFQAVYDVLEARECVGIFPEGRNSPDGQVATFRSGVARMAFGAEARNDFNLGVRIVPVGLHFEQRDRFFTGVLIRVGEPIHVADWREAWEEDPHEAARNLTATLQAAIRGEALHIVEAQQTELVRTLSDIAGEKLIDRLFLRLDVPRKSLRRRFLDELRNTPYPHRDLDDAFRIQQYIADVVEALEREHPAALVELQRVTRLYRDHVQQAKLRHETLLEEDLSRVSSTRESVRLTVYAIACLPVALWGLVHHVLPWFLVRSVGVRVKDEAIRAITWFSASLLAFPLAYTLLGWWLWRHQGLPPSSVAGYLLTLPPAGFFWLRYLRQILRYRQRILARTLFRSRRGLLESLVRERRQVLETFQSVAALTSVEPPGEAAALRSSDR